MIDRHVTSQINQLKTGFPVLAVTGPRQSGKTTLLKEMFSGYEYFNLENPEILSLVENDPAGFINLHKKKVILDEVQRVPQLLSYIQAIVDEQKVMGNFIISSSENMLLSEKINQSLAGRAAYIQLYPLSNQELAGANLLKSSMYHQIFTGFYPAIYDRKINPIDYYNQYIATYVERDLKQISNIANLSLFRKFLALLAGRVGQLVNLSSIANDVGVSVMTIENWLSILEASYLVVRLQPYYQNFGKRHIKSPKLYFTDTGLVCRLLRISSAQELQNHYLIGSLFENFIFMEIKKFIANHANSSQLYFFRDSNGNEIDLIIDSGTKRIPVEIKAGGTFSPDFLKGIHYWQTLVNSSRSNGEQHGFIIYGGKQTQSSKNYSLLQWDQLDSLLQEIR
jgi:hypothetical protein